MAHRELNLRERRAIEDMLNAKISVREIAADVRQRKPKGFLFDEPLSNLDASLRVDMRFEIARLHKMLETTMVYVTHDQVEAMTLADRIVVLKDGQIMQVGTPRELYENPKKCFCRTIHWQP